MAVIPFVIAWYLAAHPQLVDLGTNNGDLITPPVTTEPNDMSGYDSFSAENIKELQGHWLMINFLPDGKCSQACQDALYKTRQISLMMGKDIARIRRLALLDRNQAAAFPKDWQEDARLLKMLASPALQAKLQAMAPSGLDGGLMIMDPLGNLMMKYPAGFDPYQVRNDLSKLLRISQIG
jgi:hypothetical protein